MKKTLVRLKVRREVVQTLTRRDLTIVAGGAVVATEKVAGCLGGNLVGQTDP
jgi:hypothetical protein